MSASWANLGLIELREEGVGSKRSIGPRIEPNCAIRDTLTLCLGTIVVGRLRTRSWRDAHCQRHCRTAEPQRLTDAKSRAGTTVDSALNTEDKSSGFP